MKLKTFKISYQHQEKYNPLKNRRDYIARTYKHGSTNIFENKLTYTSGSRYLDPSFENEKCMYVLDCENVKNVLIC